MSLSKGSKAIVLLGCSSIVLFIFLLVFRVFIYPSLYIAPGDAYGIADVIELALGVVLVCMLALASVFSLYQLVKGPAQNRYVALGMLGLAVGLVVAYPVILRIVT